jgi:hypothetical protein
MKKIKSQFFQKYLLIGLAFCLLLFIMLLGNFSLASAIQIAILDSGVTSNHEKQILDLFHLQLQSCRSCKLISFPIYNKKGELTQDQFLQALKEAEKKNVQIIHLSWNLPYDKKFDVVIAEINRISKKIFIVGAAGAHSDAENLSIFKISDTVMGKVPKALIVGELSPDKKIKQGSWMGPEMITALTPPMKYSGSSFSAVLFSSELAKTLAKYDLKSNIKTDPKSKNDKSFSIEDILKKIKKNRDLSPDPFPTLKQLLSF